MHFLGVLEVENIDNAEDNQLPQQNPHFEDTENENGKLNSHCSNNYVKPENHYEPRDQLENNFCL